MMTFDDGNGVRQQYKERLRELEHERFAEQSRRLHQCPGVIACWSAWLGTRLNHMVAARRGAWQELVNWSSSALHAKLAGVLPLQENSLSNSVVERSKDWRKNDR